MLGCTLALLLFANSGLLPQLTRGAEALAVFKTSATLPQVGWAWAAGRWWYGRGWALSRHGWVAIPSRSLLPQLLPPPCRQPSPGSSRCLRPLSPPAASTAASPTPLHPPPSHLPACLQTIIRAICANWFVCLAVWQATATQTLGGKFIACLGPISAFVCIGLEHCIANMFFGERVGSGRVWSGLVWSGLVWSGLVWSGLVFQLGTQSGWQQKRPRAQ